jgi:hypothetical protein
MHLYSQILSSKTTKWLEHTQESNIKVNVFQHCIVPFITSLLHPNLAIWLINSRDQHFLDCSLHKTVEHLICQQPCDHPVGPTCKYYTKLTIINYMNQMISIKMLQFSLICIWVLFCAKTTKALLSIPICKLRKHVTIE